MIMLVGPTAVGKTSVAIELAAMLGTEIISSDSMQIYRHMDIGTEKPSPAQLAAVRHHMIDVAEPSELYSTGRYIDAAAAIIGRLHGEGRIPIVTGGTGLYIKAMTRGLFDGPEADWELRGELELLSTPKMYARLVSLDQVAASTIMPADRRRIVRALEVCLISGRKVSELKAELTRPLPYDFIKLALIRDRKELYGMIDARAEGMMARGLLAEVRKLMELNPCMTAMQAIGYKEMVSHLSGELSLGEAVELVKRNTRRYAKRQMSWFRGEEGLRWIDVTGCLQPVVMLGRVIEELSACGVKLER